jgi:hypothetical protein
MEITNAQACNTAVIFNTAKSFIVQGKVVHGHFNYRHDAFPHKKKANMALPIVVLITLSRLLAVCNSI